MLRAQGLWRSGFKGSGVEPLLSDYVASMLPLLLAEPWRPGFQGKRSLLH